MSEIVTNAKALTGENGLKFNYSFVEKVNRDGEGFLKQAAEGMNNFFRDKIREASFVRKILPPDMVTASDLVENLDNDQPMRVVYVESGSFARPLTYLAQPEERYKMFKKVPVFFTDISSEEFFKPLTEILTYRIPFKNIIQEQYMKEIQKEEDRLFINAVNSVVDDRLAGTIPGLPADPFAEVTAAGLFSNKHVVAAANAMVGKEIPASIVLVNEQDFNNLALLDNTVLGSGVVGDQYLRGITTDTLWGKKFVRSIKNDIIPPGTAYMFSTPEFFGNFSVLQDLKSFMRLEDGNKLRFRLFENVGMSIININGVVRIKTQ